VTHLHQQDVAARDLGFAIERSERRRPILLGTKVIDMSVAPISR
jgi:hypothetical protein